MSVIPSLIVGMEGSKETKMFMPTTGLGAINLTSRHPVLGAFDPNEDIPNIMNNPVVDYSTRRVVLPCQGIGHHVLRTPPVESSNAYQVNQGFAGDQPKGLASLPEYPTKAMLMPATSNVEAGRISMM